MRNHHLDHSDSGSESKFKKGRPKGFVFGSLLIIVGVLWILRNLGMFTPQAEDVIFSWQMLLIGIGVLNIFSFEHRVSGVILIVVGVFFMLPKFMFVPEIKHLFWPVVFIAIGLIILFKRRAFKHRLAQDREDSVDFIDEVAIFGGSERIIASKNFKGGKSVSIFGGSTFDLLNSELAEGNNIIDSFMIFGGTKLIVPPDWNVKVEVTSILGGFSDKRNRISENPQEGKQLTIKGIAIFGGGEVKNA